MARPSLCELAILIHHIFAHSKKVDGACLSQNFLQDILRRRLSELGIEVELNKGLVSLQQDEEKVIVKVLAYQNGEPTKETELISAHYIIGADGAKGRSLVSKSHHPF